MWRERCNQEKAWEKIERLDRKTSKRIRRTGGWKGKNWVRPYDWNLKPKNGSERSEPAAIDSGQGTRKVRKVIQ